MKWFGSSWGAPVCEPEDHVPTPVGRECPVCSEAVQEGAQGLLLPFVGGPGDPPDIPYHLTCFMLSVSAGPHRGAFGRIEILDKVPTQRFFVQGKTPLDEPDHPYGQWSLAVEPVDGSLAYLTFISEEAPKLIPGLRIELFRGATRVGTAVVK